MDTTQVSTDGQMDKQNGIYIYTYNGIALSLIKKEVNSGTCFKMDES